MAFLGRSTHAGSAASRCTRRVAANCNGVKVEIITANLGKPDAARALWANANANGPIDILINNAGFGYFRRFDEVDWARDAELVQLNMTSLVALARCFVDARKTSTGPAHMVNIASTGAYQAVPNMALYAASKAFVRNFSEALHDEHRGTPLSVTCIRPGGTETAFHATSGGGDYSWIANASTKSAEFVAHAALQGTVVGACMRMDSRRQCRHLTPTRSWPGACSTRRRSRG